MYYKYRSKEANIWLVQAFAVLLARFAIVLVKGIILYGWVNNI